MNLQQLKAEALDNYGQVFKLAHILKDDPKQELYIVEFQPQAGMMGDAVTLCMNVALAQAENGMFYRVAVEGDEEPRITLELYK